MKTVHTVRRHLILFLSFCMAVVVTSDDADAAPSAQAATPLPNLIFILADDLGRGDLGCYGGKVIPTPHLDRMAAEGLRFTQAYSGSTICAPSRCALMTGQHTGHAQVRTNTKVGDEGQQPLAEGSFTLSGMIKQAGYATGAFGKWALGGPGSTGEPARVGFDAFYGYLCQNLAHDFYPTQLRRHAEAVPLDGKSYSHALIFDEALGFIRQHAEHPFFLYLPVTPPHGKLDVPDASAFADKPWPQLVKNYAAMVAMLDHDVGRLLGLLKQLHLDENTLVFFASDNGPEVHYFKTKQAGSDLVPDYLRILDSNGPLRGHKRDLYEGGIRVPLIARWPGKVKTGVTDHACAFWDILPTLAEIIGQKSPSDLDGISFAPTLLGSSTQRQHEHLYWEFHEGGFAQAVRFGPWKALRLGNASPVELYNLTADESETRDIAAHHPEQVKRATQLMQECHSPSPHLRIIETKIVKGSGYSH